MEGDIPGVQLAPTNNLLQHPAMRKSVRTRFDANISIVAKGLAWVTFVVSLPGSALALSCMPMEERFFLTCSEGACSAEFRTVPIQTLGGPCARRDTIAEIDPRLAAYLVQLVKASQQGVPNGLYSLRFRFPWWRYESSDTLEHFQKSLLGSYYLGRDTNFANTPVNEVAEQLNRATSRAWLRLEPKESSVAKVKQDILDKSARDLARGIGGLVACWTLLLALVGVLAYTARVFYLRLTVNPSGIGARRLVLPIAIQTALLLIPIVLVITPLWVVFFWMFECLVILLLSPAVLLVWLLEIFWAVRHRREKSGVR